MNLYFRFIWLLLRRMKIKDPVDVMDPCATEFRVNWMDLDLNFHMNNGRYLSVMDLGRFDLMLRSRIFWKFLKQGYYPVVFSESIRFNQSLEPFQKFTVVTQIESLTEKDFFMSQKFMNQEKILAEGYIKGRFKKRGRKGSVLTSEIFELAGKTYTGELMTDLAKAQVQVESLLAKKRD